MKYTIETTINTADKNKYLFFWGHQPSNDGSITKSCFSQWYESGFDVGDIHYKTAEHYMMAEKARLFDPEMSDQIVQCNTAAEAKKLGRKVQNFEMNVWLAHREEIVITANYHKFSQNDELEKFLVSTNTRILVEASPVDAIWGIGMAADHADCYNPEKWRGLNLLGFALMEVRDRIRNA